MKERNKNVPTEREIQEMKKKMESAIMVPRFEKENMLRYIREHLQVENPREQDIDAIWYTLFEGFLYDGKFASKDDLAILKQEIPAVFLKNDARLKSLNRVMKDEVCRNNVYLFSTFWKDGMNLEDLVIDLNTEEGSAFFEVYWLNDDRKADISLGNKKRKARLMQEMLSMWGMKIVGIDRNAADLLEEALNPGEQMVLESKNKELILLAFKKGFMDRRHTRKYIHYVMCVDACEYLEIVPLLMGMEKVENSKAI